jgi:hypothetical protein
MRTEAMDQSPCMGFFYYLVNLHVACSVAVKKHFSSSQNSEYSIRAARSALLQAVSLNNARYIVTQFENVLSIMMSSGISLVDIFKQTTTWWRIYVSKNNIALHCCLMI